MNKWLWSCLGVKTLVHRRSSFSDWCGSSCRNIENTTFLLSFEVRLNVTVKEEKRK